MTVLELATPAVHSLTTISQGRSDAGGKPTNEDYFLIAELPPLPPSEQIATWRQGRCSAVHRAHLFLVADGMGKRGGQVASKLAAQTVEATLLRSWEAATREEDPEEVAQLLREAFLSAHRNIVAEARRRPLQAGMGTTLTVALLVRDQIHLAHAGNSRCFLYRGDRLYQLTHDHTLPVELLRTGKINAAEVEHHPLRAVLTNQVGGKHAHLEVEINRLPVRPRDWLLLCTAGVTDVVRDGELTAVLRAVRSPKQACTRLLKRAKQLGGRDNLTVVAVELGLSD